MYRLNQVAHIISGHAFRKKVQHNENGDICLLQMKDVKDQQIEWRSTLTTYIPSIKVERILQNGDILLLSKGNQNTAFLIEDLQRKTSCSSHFFIIRIKHHDLINAYFLWWQLNQTRAQQYFSSRAQGSSISSLSRKHIEEFEIPKVSLSEQIAANEYVKDIYQHQGFVLRLAENDEKLISRLSDALFNSSAQTR